MKTLGATTDGNYLVEMTPSEHWTLKRLELSIRGSSTFGSTNSNLMGTDLTPLFKALCDLADAKVSIYRVQEYINNLASLFGGFVKESKDA